VPEVASAQLNLTDRQERAQSFLERVLPLFQNNDDERNDNGNSGRSNENTDEYTDDGNDDPEETPAATTSTPKEPATPATTTPAAVTTPTNNPPQPTLAAIFPFFGLVSSEPTAEAGNVYTQSGTLSPEATRVLLALSLAMAIAGLLLTGEGRWRGLRPLITARARAPHSA
jgi:hypothetical protein